MIPFSNLSHFDPSTFNRLNKLKSLSFKNCISLSQLVDMQLNTASHVLAAVPQLSDVYYYSTSTRRREV